MNRLPIAAAAIITVIVIALTTQSQSFRRIDAGGPKLRTMIAGTGGPAVVFDTGGGGALEGWGSVPEEVSKFAGTVTYDRAGNGESDKPTTPRDARHIAAELHAVLMNAQVSPPYLLVGHSVGGPYVRVFAGMYPEEVAGMVLLDPTQEEMVAWDQEHGFERSSSATCGLDEDERGCEAATLAQAHESAVPPNVPVFLIHVTYPWGETPFRSKEREEIKKLQMVRLPARLKFHKEWVEKIPGGKFIVAEKSSHGLLNFEEPELVIRTIREAVDKARAMKSSSQNK